LRALDRAGALLKEITPQQGGDHGGPKGGRSPDGPTRGSAARDDRLLKFPPLEAATRFSERSNTFADQNRPIQRSVNPAPNSTIRAHPLPCGASSTCARAPSWSS